MFKTKMNIVQKNGSEWLMSDRRAEKRDELRIKLIEAAEVRIARSGLSELRAREVTADAGCALGALYNVFADLDMLILEVNARTLRRLDAEMTAALESAGDPSLQMHKLAQTYLSFARREPKLWWSLFQFHMSGQKNVPEWFSEEQTRLLTQIVRPLSEIQPTLSRDKLIIRARTLFAAVHGIVSISLEQRFVGIPEEALDGELTRFVDLLLAGLPALGDR